MNLQIYLDSYNTQMPCRTRRPQLSAMGSMAKCEGIKISLLQKILPKVSLNVNALQSNARIEECSKLRFHKFTRDPD
ncbi:hypothetical protein BOTNAR_0513g00080 [Botryotinia narcissicola]|uniref:Uncharacterized protein n=1 Tax=Botryotinia narcissicola TaxID=278944 RepID=A0A4Z1HLM8_9HELO|nr:hypothetical protein BOTNAR_0513g00080 [Botryotinia narcissicola]